jgi:hypothetical protein
VAKLVAETMKDRAKMLEFDAFMTGSSFTAAFPQVFEDAAKLTDDGGWWPVLLGK